MTLVLCIPLLIQAVLMFIDEIHFHRLRGLPRWERVGHPIDTFSVLLCYGVALTQPPSGGALTVYAALAILSCLLITKDEFVHARLCPPAEQWLHALLFVVHPIVLGATGLLWFKHKTAILAGQSAMTVAFGCYQLIYWNHPWKRHPRAQ